MVVKSLYIKKFGKLKDISLSFDEGFNIIEGKNEAGKSTIAAFIKFMLYGSPKDRATKDNPIPEKEKYIPWDGDGIAAGSLTVNFKGRNIVVEREFRKSVSKKLSVYDEATGEPLDIFDNAEPGRTMFDISAETFERTAFIRQSDLSLGECSELEIKLRNLVTGADENVSYASAHKILDNYRRRLENSRGGGIIPELKDNIERLKISLASASKLKEQYDEIMLASKEMREKKSELDKKLKELRKELTEAQNYGKYEKYTKIKAARDEQRECLARRDAVMDTLLIDGKPADIEYISKIRQMAHDLRLEEERLTMCSEDLKEGVNRLLNIEKEMKSFGTVNDNFDEIVKKLENAPKTRTRLLLPAGGVTASFSVLVFIAYLIFGRSLILLIPSILIFLTGGILMLLHFVIKRPNSPEAIAKLYGYKNSGALNEALGRLSQVKKEYDNAKSVYNEALDRERLQKNVCGKIKNILAGFCTARGIDTVTPSAVDMLCANMEEDLHRAEAFYARFDQIEERIAGLLDGADEKELCEASKTPPHSIPRDIAVIEAELEQLNEEYNKTEIDCIHLEHRADTIFNGNDMPVKISDMIEEKTKELNERQKNLSACNIALNAMQDAFSELQMTFAPELNSRAGKYFAALTDSGKRELLMDSNSVVRIKDEGIIRELSYFSAGTRDSAYFSVRLAAADLIFNNERPPLIFDDTFARLDNIRLKQVIETLCRISCMYQIMLFTCREEDKNQTSGEFKLINI